MNEAVKVRTVTYGRKMPVEKYGGNAEYILTAEVGPGQTVEEVMASLHRLVSRELAEIVNENIKKYEEE